jgi:hypothetical protein
MRYFLVHLKFTKEATVFLLCLLFLFLFLVFEGKNGFFSSAIILSTNTDFPLHHPYSLLPLPLPLYFHRKFMRLKKVFRRLRMKLHIYNLKTI